MEGHEGTGLGTLAKGPRQRSAVEVIDDADPFAYSYDEDNGKNRGGEPGTDPTNITDPDDDEDLDDGDDGDDDHDEIITDPDDDEDLDEEDQQNDAITIILILYHAIRSQNPDMFMVSKKTIESCEKRQNEILVKWFPFSFSLFIDFYQFFKL